MIQIGDLAWVGMGVSCVTRIWTSVFFEGKKSLTLTGSGFSLLWRLLHLLYQKTHADMDHISLFLKEGLLALYSTEGEESASIKLQLV